jgi:hypothetical protein
MEWAKKAAFPHDSHLSYVGSTQAEDLADRIPHVRPALLVKLIVPSVHMSLIFTNN